MAFKKICSNILMAVNMSDLGLAERSKVNIDLSYLSLVTYLVSIMILTSKVIKKSTIFQVYSHAKTFMFVLS